jgi:hypothetical protein
MMSPGRCTAAGAGSVHMRTPLLDAFVDHDRSFVRKESKSLTTSQAL